MFTWLRKLFSNAPPPLDVAPSDALEQARKRISHAAMALSKSKVIETPVYKFQAPELPPGVVPANAKSDPDYMALDSAACSATYNYLNGQTCHIGFIGYPSLSQLTQISEYRSPSETIAKEMVRKWIRLVSHGDGDNAAKLEKIESELKRHNVKDIFERAALHDGFFGRGHVYINIKGQEGDKRKLPLIIDPATIKKGTLMGFKNIEPMWTTPFMYNSNDPTADDFYKPRMWYLLGQQVHATRLMGFVSREVPDILKPSYNFGGQSLTQLMQPYVDSWIRTRDSIADLIKAFSITGIKTDLQSILNSGSGDDLFNRLDFFNATRDNRGLMALQNGAPGEGEELIQLNTPLSTLDALQAQSQEHMSAPCHIPLVKLLGITPTGLNANSEGEMTVFYDFVGSCQTAMFATNLKTVIDVIQLDQFGMIDEAIGFEFIPLEQLNGTELAAVRKSDADAAAVLIAAAVISIEEERARLAADPNSGYNSLEVEDLPEVQDNNDELDDGDKNMQASDATFSEGDHPRASNGEFGSGGSASHSANVRQADYERSKKTKGELEAKASAANEVLQQFPKGAMGLTPDHVRASPEFQAASRAYETAAKESRDHNGHHFKKFKKESNAEPRTYGRK